MSGKTQKSGVSASGAAKKTLQTRHSSFTLQAGLDIKTVAKKLAVVTDKKHKSNISKAKSSYSITEAGTKKVKPQYDEAATKKFDNMLDGDMTDLPPLPKTMVKIFLSSTFSDMRAERNLLARQVYPVLREFCAGHQLDFQVVDMRWGVTEDSQNDHSVEKLCLLEVQNCQKTSLGPNFVVLSGDRYGFRPVPTEIDLKEFMILRSEASRLEMEDAGLMDDWYKLDTNCIPNMYLLQPIRSKFTFFADYSPGCDEPRQRDTAAWWKTFEKLQGLLRICADEAFKQQKLSAEQRHQYFCSVTECEIQEGILKAADVNSHVLVYKRELVQLTDEALCEDNAGRFVDIVKTSEGWKRNEEVSALKEKLITQTIPSKLGKDQIKFYTVNWNCGGVDPDSNINHKQYLEKFCVNFVTDCQRQIGEAVEQKQNQIMMSNYYSDYEDTIHHLRFCQSKCESFCGQEKVIEKAKAYILDESSRAPLIIHGGSGSGKTSITAMIMQLVPTWLKGAGHVKLIRFLGTSPQSNNIYDVLFSVVGQLSDACDIIMSPLSYKNMKNLVSYLPRFLRQAANALRKPIVIMLDSVDQLYPTNGAYGMEWLPTLLPPNVKVIVSTITEHQGILTNLKQRLPDDTCYIEVPVLPESTGKLIVETYLKHSQRTITESQMKLLLTQFKQSPSPLFLKLLIDGARKWKSYTDMNEVCLASTVKEAINGLFENLESKFGSLLISHTLGYITLGITGLTEFEIEDVLSCDDDVLNEVYRFHDPPIPGIVRIPPVLWARIRYDIQEYLVERLSHGKTTLYWYHRQFIETARERYASKGKDVLLHKNLTEIYLQDSGVRRTITLKHRKNLIIPDADREVRPLPFTTQNQRKLVCLPYHAMKAQTSLGKEIVKANVFCNFKFLTTKIAAFSVSSIVTILQDFLNEQEDSEVSELMNFFTTTKNDLSYPTRLAVCLLSNINPDEKQPILKALQDDAREYLLQQTKPLLIPAFPCLAPRQNLSYAPSTSIQGLTDVLASSNEILLLKNKQTDTSSEEGGTSEYAIFDAATLDLLQVQLTTEAKSLSPASFAVDEDQIFFSTKSTFVKYNYKTAKTSTVKLSEMIPNWEKKDVVLQILMSPDSSMAVLVFNSFLVLVDISSMKCKQKYETDKKFTELETATFMNNDEDVKILASGSVVNSTSDDEPQGPQNQKFVCIFCGSKETPEEYLAADAELCPESMTLVGNNNRRIVFATKGDDNSSDVNVAKLEIFELSPLSHVNSLYVPGEVKMLEADPTDLRMVALTTEGILYVLDVVEYKIVSKTQLGQSISSVSMLWEEQVGFLSGSSGTVTLYALKENKTVGAFTASQGSPSDARLCDQQFVYLDTNWELKSWSAQTLLADSKNTDQDTGTSQFTEEQILDQDTVSCIGISIDGHEIYMCTREGFLKIWSLDSQILLRQYTIGISASELLVFSDSTAALLDVTLGQLIIIDPETGTYPVPKSALPSSVIAMTTNLEKTKMFSVCSPQKDHLQVDIYSTQFKKIEKTFALQKSVSYTSVDLTLCAKERYLVLKTGVSDKEFESIQALTKKSGSFGPQLGRWKFQAVDLSQGSGAQIPCFRRLSKIPTLGTTITPFSGNTMMLGVGRWMLLWDIPTGNCDQRTCKPPYKHIGMFCRPGWVGEGCKGASRDLTLAPNRKFIATGSEDGYVFIYDTETGLPRGKAKPKTKHNSEVHMVAVSPDSQWVASTCQGSILKLWDSDSGQEKFSFRLDAKVQRIMFAPDSATLALYTGTHTTRVLIFSVHK